MIESIDKKNYIKIDPNDEETKKLYGDLLKKFNKPIYLFKQGVSKESGKYNFTEGYIADRIRVAAGAKNSNIYFYISKEDYRNNADVISMSGDGIFGVKPKSSYIGNMVSIYSEATGEKIEKDPNFKPITARMDILEPKVEELVEGQEALFDLLAYVEGKEITKEDLQKCYDRMNKMSKTINVLNSAEAETYDSLQECKLNLQKIIEESSKKVNKDTLKEYVKSKKFVAALANVNNAILSLTTDQENIKNLNQELQDRISNIETHIAERAGQDGLDAVKKNLNAKANKKDVQGIEKALFDLMVEMSEKSNDNVDAIIDLLCEEKENILETQKLSLTKKAYSNHLFKEIERLGGRLAETHDIAIEDRIRIDEIEAKLQDIIGKNEFNNFKNQVENRLDAHDKILDDHGKRLDAHDKMFAEIKDQVDNRLNEFFKQKRKGMDADSGYYIADPEKLPEDPNQKKKDKKTTKKDCKKGMLKAAIGFLVFLAFIITLGGGHHLAKALGITSKEDPKPQLIVQQKDNAETGKGILDDLIGITKKTIIDKSEVETNSSEEITANVEDITPLGNGYYLNEYENGVAIFKKGDGIYYGYKVKNGKNADGSAKTGTVFIKMNNKETIDGAYSGSLTELVVSKDGKGGFNFETRGMNYTVPDETEIQDIIEDYINQLNRLNAKKSAMTLIMNGVTEITGTNYTFKFAEESIDNINWKITTSAANVDETTK